MKHDKAKGNPHTERAESLPRSESFSYNHDETTSLLSHSGLQGSSSTTIVAVVKPEDKNKNLNSSKLRFQITALACTMLLSFGSHYAALTLGSLKNTIKKEMGISNTQYGVLQSSVSLVNTILPLIGGIFVDCFGTTRGSLVATTFILLGTVLVALSTNLVSFPLMVLGRALYGIGSGTIVIVQETIISQWFTGKGLTITLGINLAVSRLASFLGMATIIPISEYSGFYGNALWFSAFLCLVSFIMNLVYYTMVLIADQQLSPEDLVILRSKKQLNLSFVTRLPGQFWLLMLLAFFMMGGWNTFLHINPELIKLRFGNSDELAARKASISQILPIFAPPLLGHWIEKRGNRPQLVILSSLTFMLTMLLIGFTHASPVTSMIIFSFSLSLGVIPSISSIPLLLPSGIVGTGFGLYKTTISVSSVLQDIIAGALQDDKRGAQHSYDFTIGFLLLISGCSFVISLGFFLIDKCLWNGFISLATTERQIKFPENGFNLRISSEDNDSSLYHPLLGNLKHQTPAWYNLLPPVLLGLALLSSWYLFIVFFF
ncbi:hypothetical protein DSO57_1019944 [Entomophthora muscae]|uniref:Uncharacterized protein n=1 Tax=Entomophthora muscae TaxID=34485 RepID=A0ACC2S5R5_9FUNG|nr:hypothetical protein DSO57_1019944 [Entomophthora muscae]